MAPTIDLNTLIDYARSRSSNAIILHEIVNPEHQSWRLKIVIPGELAIEFFWGPLTGFGVSDFLKPVDLADDADPFAPFDTHLASIDEARQYIDEKTNRA